LLCKNRLNIKESEEIKMAVSLISMNYDTKAATFSYDDWTNDKDKLPKIGIAGKDGLSTIKGCSQGSYALGTDGTIKTLNGDTNEWIDY
jgi:hypothetical protein